MAVRRDGNQSGSRKRKPRAPKPDVTLGGDRSKRTGYTRATTPKPATQGHPSRGRPTVSGGTKKRPKTRTYKSPTPSLRKQRQRNAARREAARALRRTRRALRAVGRERTEIKHSLNIKTGERDELKGRTVAVPTESEQRRYDRKLSRNLKTKQAENIGKTVAPGLKALEVSTRPAKVVGNVIAGERVDKAFTKGVKGEGKLPGEALGLGGVAGFAADVALDPTTYASFGTAVPAKKALQKAGDKAAKKAKKAGMSEAGQETVRRAATKRAAAKAKAEGKDNKGLSVGFGIGHRRVRTSGKTTAAVSRKIGASKGAKRIRRTKAVQAVGRHMRPDFRPEGVGREAHQAVRVAGRRSRAGAHQGQRKAQARAVAYSKALSRRDYERVIDAIEANKLSKLPAPLRKVAKQMRDDFRYMQRLERERGIAGKPHRKTTPEDAAGYFPHTRRQDIEPGAPKVKEKGRASKLGSSQGRTIQQPLKEIREESPELFSEDVPLVFGHRAMRSAKGVADADFIKAVADTGRKLSPDAEWDTGLEAVYQVTPTGLKKLEVGGKTDTKAIGGALKSEADVARLVKLRRQLYARLKKAQKPGYRAEVVEHEAEAVGAEKLLKMARQAESKAALLTAKNDTVGAKRLMEQARELREQAAKGGLAAKTVREEKQVRIPADKKAVQALKKQIREVEAEIKSPQGQYVILNKKMADDAMRLVNRSDSTLAEVGRFWDRKVQGPVKTMLTVPNPQYHFTNLYGDTFNAYLGDVSARSLAQAARAIKYVGSEHRAARKLDATVHSTEHGLKIGGKHMSFHDLIKEAEDSGAIGTGFIGRDLPDVLEAFGNETATRVGAGRVARRLPGKARKAAARAHPIRGIREISQYREDFVRLASYISARKAGKSADEAAEHVAKHHFDYGDLTEFERTVLRRVFPFYTFTARNAPLQAEKLVTRPGKYATLEKARVELARSQGREEGYEQNLEEYEQRGLPLPIPGMVDVDGHPLLLYPKLPAMDLNRLTGNPYKQCDLIASMISPIIKSPFEFLFNYNTFFRGPIDEMMARAEDVKKLSPALREKFGLDDDSDFVTLVPAPSLVKLFPEALRKELGIKKYKEKKSGETIWGWPSRLDYLLKTPGPLATTAIQFGSDTKAPNRQGRNKTLQLVGWMTGLKFSPYNPADQLVERRLTAYFSLQAKAQVMRRRGTDRTPDGEYTKEYRKTLDFINELGPQINDASKARGDKVPLFQGASPKKKSVQDEFKEFQREQKSGSVQDEFEEFLKSK